MFKMCLLGALYSLTSNHLQSKSKFDFEAWYMFQYLIIIRMLMQSHFSDTFMLFMLNFSRKVDGTTTWANTRPSGR